MIERVQIKHKIAPNSNLQHNRSVSKFSSFCAKKDTHTHVFRVFEHKRMKKYKDEHFFISSSLLFSLDIYIDYQYSIEIFGKGKKTFFDTGVLIFRQVRIEKISCGIQ